MSLRVQQGNDGRRKGNRYPVPSPDHWLEAGVLSLRFAVLSAVFIVLRAVHSHPPFSYKDNGSKEMCVFEDEMIHRFAGCPR